MALSEERRRRLEEEQRKAVQNNLRAAAAADAAKFDLLERQRQQSQRIDQSRINAEIRAQRRAQAEAYAAREEALTNLPDYRAYNREIWKESQRPQADLNYAAQRADRELSAAQRQRDRIRNGNSYWNRQAQAQEQKQYGSYMDRMSQPVRRDEVDEDQLRSEYGTDYVRMLDRSQSVQPDLNAASQYGQALGRRQDALNRAEDRMYYARQEKDVLERERDYARNGDVAQAVRRLGEAGTLDPNRAGAFDTDGKRIARDVYNSVIGNIGMVSGQTDVHIDQMNDVEKATILNMAQDGKWTDIEKFTNALQATLDARWYDTQETRIAQMPTAAQVGYGMLGTFTAPAAYAQVAADTLTGRRTDPKSGAVGATRLAQTAREQSLANAGTVGRFVGNVAYSMADNLTTMALGPTGAIVWLGLSAAGNEAANALANGARQGQAFTKATVSGAIETATEKMGIDNLFDTVLKSGSRGLKNALKDIAKQFGSEGAEEIISEFANTFADKAIMGQQSEYNNAIRDYEASGLSHDDAVKRANLDFFVKNPALAGLAGALSGALFGVGGVATQRIRQGASDLATGRDITNNRHIADVVLDEGMKSTDQRIRDEAYRMDAIRRENERTDGFQWSAADQRRIGEIFDSLDTDARRRVLETDKYREAQRQAAENKEIKAREAVLQAEQDEKVRSEAQQRLDELEAETDRMMEDAETVDLDSIEAEEAADTTTRRGSDEYTDRVETAEDVDADLRRRAAAAEEATRTGDRSALDNLDQARRTTQSTAQTNRQTAQQEPVNPTQQRRDMKKQVRDVYSSMGITSEVSVGEIADAMQDAYNTIAKEGSNTEAAKTATNALLQVAQEHFEEDMLRQAEEDRDRQFGTEDEVYTQARKTIRGTRLYVPQSLNASELGVDSLNEFRRANFGVLNLTRDSQAMPIDTFYDELVREYPGLFPAPDSEGGPTSEADMLRTIAEVYRSRGNTMQAEPIDTNAIRNEARQKAFGVLSNAVVQAQQAYNNAQNAARESADQIAQKTAENARKAGLSNEETLVMSNVARDLGVNLQFQKMKYDIVNGFYDRKSNTIVLNQNLSTAEKAWTTFAHEITHAAETADSYNQLRDVAKQYGMKGATDEAWRLAVDEQRRDYLKAGVKLSKDEAEFELVANTIQKILGSREAMEGVVQYSREDAQALLSSVDNILDRVTTNSTAITQESARLVQAQKALAAALGEVQEQRSAENVKPGDVRGEVDYSLALDDKYQDNAENKNESTHNVDTQVLQQAGKDRARVKEKLESVKDEANLPPDVPGNTAQGNSAYGTSEENTTICPRTMGIDRLSAMVAEKLGRPLTVEESLFIAQDAFNFTDMPQCLYCYVAMDRMAKWEYMGEYLKKRNGVIENLRSGMSVEEAREAFKNSETDNGKQQKNWTKAREKRFNDWVRNYQSGARTIELSNLASKATVEKAMKDRQLAPQIKDAMRYAQSASWAKKRVGYTAYNGHILNWKQSRIDMLNSLFGLRMYSFSDYSPAFVLENMQMVTDAAVRGLKMLGYTKELDFVRIFAPTNMNINISVFGMDGANGTVHQDAMQGADWAEAQKLREQFPNVGITFVATNDAQIEWALDQDWIDVIIPFHMVKTGATVAKIQGFINYTSESSDRTATGKKGEIYPNEHQNDREKYFAALKKQGLEPRFKRWADHPNYMKLVNETRRSAQDTPAVQPIFNVDAALKSIDGMVERGGYDVPIGGTLEKQAAIAKNMAENIAKGMARGLQIRNGVISYQNDGESRKYKVGIDESLIDEMSMLADNDRRGVEAAQRIIDSDKSNGKVQYSLDTETDSTLDGLYEEFATAANAPKSLNAADIYRAFANDDEAVRRLGGDPDKAAEIAKRIRDRLELYQNPDNESAADWAIRQYRKKYANTDEMLRAIKSDFDEDIDTQRSWSGEWDKTLLNKYVSAYEKTDFSNMESVKNLFAVAADAHGQNDGEFVVLGENYLDNNKDIRYSVEGVDVDDIYRRALEKYGRMRSGEQLVDEQGNPVTRQTTLPKQTSDKTRTRGLYRTADEANSVQIDVREKAIMDQYKPTSNQENVAKANEMRSKFKGENSFDKAYGAWQDMVDKGLSSRYGVLSNQIAFAETLFMEAQREGRIQEAYTILSDLAQFGTTAGQAVQALSLIKRLSPEGQLMHYNRVVENFANSGKKGKTPANVQTVMTTQEDIDKLLNSMTELRKLKRFEANGGKMTEAVARRIAELEKEIEALQTKLAPQLEKYNRLVQEKNATTLERNKLKREEKTLPKNIKNTEERIKNLRAEIDDLNNELEPKRMELQAKLADEDLAKEERNKAKKELDAINRKIKAAQKRINNLRAEIQTYFDEMPLRTMKLHEMLLYERYLASAKEVMDIYLRYTKNKGGNVKVPENLQVEYLDAKTEEEREAVRKKMDIAIADQLPGTWSEKIRGWRYISMLFNPTTHLRNMAGNTVQYGLKGMRDTIATGLERAFIRGDGERTKAIMNRFSKADKAYFDAAQEDYKIIEDDLQAGGKASETQGIENARKIYGNKYAEAVRRFSGDLLEREDKIFLRANYTQSFAEYLKANKIDPANMTDAQKERARQIAFQQALEATYRDASTIASVLNDLEKKGAGWEFALGGIMPFKKTPVNVLKRGVEYSPAGIIKATYDMIQMTRGKNAKTKSDIIGEYAAGLTGSMVAALGLLAAKAGIALASPGDDDKDRKKAMDEATGQQDYAIKFNVGGKEWTYTFDWVAPASMAFFAGVRAYEAWRGKEDFSLQAALDGLISTINPVFELSMLDGLAGMFKSYASDEAGTAAAVAWSILESYALQFFPTVGGKLARAIDPYQRSTYSPKDSPYTKNLERLYRRAMAKIPGASYMLEPVIDQYGNLKENIGKNFIGRLGYNLTSPGYIKPVTHYAADEEMKRLYAQVGETYVLPKEMPTSWEFDGETYYLDSAEYRKWGERQGKYVYDELDKLYQTPEYKAANDTQKAKMVEKVINAGTEYAKMGFFEDIGLIDDYYRHTLDGLVYDDTQGYRQYKTIPEATEIYEQGRIDLKTVYDANETLKGISGNAARIDALNRMNLDSDEYNFLYMTKIASNEMEADISAVINAGGSLDSAINIVSQFYKWNANAENKTTGEKGAWVSIGNGAKAEVLAQSNMTLPAIETMYLRVLTPTDDVEKQTELIDEFKDAGKNIKDYLNTKAVLYDGGVSKYKKTSDIAQAFLDSDLPDDLKELGYKTLGSDAQGVPDEIAAFKKARMTIDDYLRTKAVVGKTDANGNGLKNYEKARELLKMDLKSYTAAITSVITSSENQATGIQNCLNMGISDRKVAEGYAKYAQINANDALNATQKATEFSKWLNTDSSMSGLTTAQKDMMRASFVYFMMTPASAGRYDNLMKLDGMSSNAAESISADIAKLEPKEGSKSVSDLQRLTAVAYNTTASEKQIDLAMQQILDSSDDGTDTAGLTKYRAIRAAGMSAKQYVDFRTNTESITSDKDSNGKDIKGRTRQDKIWAYINSLPISSKQKDALHLVYYKESTLNKAPWH